MYIYIYIYIYMRGYIQLTIHATVDQLQINWWVYKAPYVLTRFSVCENNYKYLLWTLSL